MIPLKKSQKPAILEKNDSRWTEEYVVENIDKKRYNHPEIKAVLRSETNDKCAYCESKVSHVQYGDVEHIVPKSKRRELYVDWSNLTIACLRCNREFKNDKYAVESPIVNPFCDNPSEEFLFLGPLIWNLPGSDKAMRSIKYLGLDRVELNDRRRDHLERLHRLVELWAKEKSADIRAMYREAILLEMDDSSEFAGMSRQYVRVAAPRLL